MSLLSCQKSNAELCNLPRMSSKLHLPGIVRLLQTCHRQKRHFHKHVLQFWLSWGALLHTRISTSPFEKMVEASCQNVITSLQVLLSGSSQFSANVKNVLLIPIQKYIAQPFVNVKHSLNVYFLV